ncbi:MAG TPA: YidC/Oxa1 family membrane protein insertase, partial [Treponemataceae bacterium]|nr:YidC/Oxa1 family membrane protein insertase [Treponemataceae bacterium]
PILYVITQIFSMKFTQAQNTSPGGGSMKIMMYGMPLFFFFIFYNAPAGLLIYWILSNVLMTGQQIIINSFAHGKEKKDKEDTVKKIIPPGKKRKNK